MSDDAREAGSALVERIERLRRERGLTVDELGERAGIDRSALEALLGGFAEMGISSLGQLAAALSVDPADLLDGIFWIPDGRGGGEYRVVDPDAD